MQPPLGVALAPVHPQRDVPPPQVAMEMPADDCQGMASYYELPATHPEVGTWKYQHQSSGHHSYSEHQLQSCCFHSAYSLIASATETGTAPRNHITDGDPRHPGREHKSPPCCLPLGGYICSNASVWSSPIDVSVRCHPYSRPGYLLDGGKPKGDGKWRFGGIWTNYCASIFITRRGLAKSGGNSYGIPSDKR
ncbi:hypothetical protein TURU_086040 [Turdus rufiventris]|nr:hypothetical protein TURU_086040 [Turdus rufiventris]